MLKVINPADGRLIAEMKETEDLRGIYEKARNAQPAWARTAFSVRKAAIEKFNDLVEKRMPELAKTLTSETGKPISQSLNELKALKGRVQFFLDETEKAIAPETVFDKDGMREQITHQPLGVIANISAWNYPYFVGSNVFVPALLTGNAVLYKPSEFSLLTGLAITSMLHEAGVPKDVFACVIGDGKTGAALLDLPIQGVYFTGSYATGKKIAQTVAPKLIRMQLELGGKDPTYVCEDADPKTAAASLADGAMYNTGQSCCSVERIYVHEKIYDAFIEEFTREVRGFVLGDPTDAKTYIGPLARRELQVEALEQQVKNAVAKGAKVLMGGKRANRDGFYFEPTVLVNVNHQMDVMKEESFGPIIGIQKVKDDAEALRLMQDTPYGLTAGIYTKNEKRAQDLLSQVNSGSAYWNCCDRVSPRLPWSGRGHSGIGSTLSKYGIFAFTEVRGWHLKRG